ncbi:hypothetical protein [Streptomyces sp. NPDC058542]|uniref:hypothetical protein n=1 Tax=Streptomyces sp. NPDC058542 TaxID=3346543 RepID=UPI00365207D8
MTIIDGRIHAEGRRIACPPDLREAADGLERSGGVAWIGLMDPGPAVASIPAGPGSD